MAEDPTPDPAEARVTEDAWLEGALDGLTLADSADLRRIAESAKPLPDTLRTAWAELNAIRRRDAGNGPLYPNALVLEVYPPETEWQDPILGWVLVGALTVFAFSLVLAWRTQPRVPRCG